jgi:hypothetical protein
MLNAGVNPNEIDKNGEPLLARNDYEKEIATLLIKHDKIDLSYIDKEGDTYLMQFIKGRHTGLVQTLLEKDKHNINVRNKEGLTALFIAVHEGNHGDSRDYVEIIKALLQAGADPFMTCRNSWLNVMQTAFEAGQGNHAFGYLFKPYQKPVEEKKQSSEAKMDVAPKLTTVSKEKDKHIIYIKNLTHSQVAVCRALFDAAAKTQKGIAEKKYAKQMSLEYNGLWSPLEDFPIEQDLRSAAISHGGALLEIGYLWVKLIFSLDSLDVTVYEELYGVSAKDILEKAGFECSDKPIATSYSNLGISTYSYGRSYGGFYDKKENNSPLFKDFNNDKRFKKSTQPGVLFEAISYGFISDKQLEEYGITKWAREKNGIDYVVFVLEMTKEKERAQKFNLK